MFPQSGFSYDNSFLQYLFGIPYRQHTMPIKFSLRVFLSFSHHFLNGSREWESLGRTSRHLPQLDASLLNLQATCRPQSRDWTGEWERV